MASTAGERFLKIPIINGPVKLLLFTSKIEVAIVLHLTWQNYQLMKKKMDPRSYSLYFYLNIWFQARKVIGTLEKRATGALNQRSFLSQRFLKLADF